LNTVIRILNKEICPNFFIDGEAPIHLASKCNNCEIVFALMSIPDNKVDLYTLDDKFQFNPLQWAISMNNIESISLLAYLCPNVIVSKNKHGNSALKMAIKSYNENKIFSNSFLFIKNSSLLDILKRHLPDSVSYEEVISSKLHDDEKSIKIPLLEILLAFKMPPTFNLYDVKSVVLIPTLPRTFKFEVKLIFDKLILGSIIYLCPKLFVAII
jgi:ankyrin repeat protein